MLIDFFLHLKARKLPVSTREFLTLLEGLRERVCGHSIDDFYHFARACLVKDESLYDRFDQAFGEYFRGVTEVPGLEVTRPSLEDVYLELIGEPVASSDPAPAPDRPGAPAAARTPDDATVVVPEEARP